MTKAAPKKATKAISKKATKAVPKKVTKAVSKKTAKSTSNKVTKINKAVSKKDCNTAFQPQEKKTHKYLGNTYRGHPSTLRKLKDVFDFEKLNFEKNNGITKINQVDLSKKKDLIEIDFTKVVLNKTNLSHSTLKGSSFSEAEIDNDTNFTNANLINTNWIRSQISNTILTNANFSNSNIGFSKFSGISAHSSNFNKANFFKIKIEGSDFQGASFKDSTFKSPSLEESEEAIITRSNFKKADFTGSNIITMNAMSSNFERAIFTDSSISTINFHLSNLAYTKFINVTFQLSTYNFINFNGSILYKADFTNSKIKTPSERILFEDAIVIGAKIPIKMKESVSFKNAIQTKEQLNTRIKELEAKTQKNSTEKEKLILFKDFKQYLINKKKQQEKIISQLITDILSGNKKELNEAEKNLLNSYLNNPLSWTLKESQRKKLKKSIKTQL